VLPGVGSAGSQPRRLSRDVGRSEHGRLVRAEADESRPVSANWTLDREQAGMPATRSVGRTWRSHHPPVVFLDPEQRDSAPTPRARES
jgi:hypothetical protein